MVNNSMVVGASIGLNSTKIKSSQRVLGEIATRLANKNVQLPGQLNNMHELSVEIVSPAVASVIKEKGVRKKVDKRDSDQSLQNFTRNNKDRESKLSHRYKDQSESR